MTTWYHDPGDPRLPDPPHHQPPPSHHLLQPPRRHHPRRVQPTWGDVNDLKATVDSLTNAMKTLHATVEANAKAIASLTSDHTSSSGSKPGSGEHHNDRPPKFQKMDFSRYDGKTDPLIFINRCESYFHQQRIMEEEKVWMASYNLEDGA